MSTLWSCWIRRGAVGRTRRATCWRPISKDGSATGVGRAGLPPSSSLRSWRIGSGATLLTSIAPSVGRAGLSLCDPGYERRASCKPVSPNLPSRSGQSSWSCGRFARLALQRSISPWPRMSARNAVLILPSPSCGDAFASGSRSRLDEVGGEPKGVPPAATQHTPAPLEHTPAPVQHTLRPARVSPEAACDAPEAVLDVPEAVRDAPEAVLDAPEPVRVAPEPACVAPEPACVATAPPGVSISAGGPVREGIVSRRLLFPVQGCLSR